MSTGAALPQSPAGAGGPRKPWENRSGQQGSLSASLGGSASRSNSSPLSQTLPSSSSRPELPQRSPGGAMGSNYGSGYGGASSSMYGGTASRYGSGMYGGAGSSMYGSGSSLYGGGSSLYGAGSSLYGAGSSMYGSRYGSGMGGYGSSMYGGGYGGSMYGSRYGSGMGGYGSSMYGGGGSMYGSRYGGGGSMYGGGGMYGGAGGMYGNRMMGMGGMGGMGPYDKFDENGNPMDRLMDGGYSWMMELENLVQGFGRFTQLLDYNFDAVHGSFESIMRLLHSVTELRRAVCYGLQAFAFVALFRKFFRSIYRFVCGLFGIKVASNVSKSQSLQNAFNAASQQTGRDGFMNGADRNQNHPGASTRSWPKTLLIFCLVFIGAPMLLSSAFSFFFGSRRSSATSAPRLRLARAVADFEGAGPNDLPFRTGDILKILGPTNEPQWLEAQLNGRVGLIPENYIQPVDPRTLTQGASSSSSAANGTSSDPSSISDLETEVDHQDPFNDQQQNQQQRHQQQQQQQQQSSSRQFYEQQQRQQQQQGFGSYGPPRNTNFASRFDSPNQFYGEDPFEDRAWNEGY